MFGASKEGLLFLPVCVINAVLVRVMVGMLSRENTVSTAGESVFSFLEVHQCRMFNYLEQKK